MKVLITGASGFLGQHIIKKLSEEGVDIAAIIRPTSRIEHLKKYTIDYITGNIRDEETLRKAMQGVDAVIHAVTTKFGGAEDFYAENVESTRQLLELSLKNNIKRFVFISSIDVYDHSKCKNGSVLDEDSPRDPNPSNHYSRTKIQAEEIVETFNRKHKLPTVIIRPGCIYGKGGNWVPARLGFSAGPQRYVLLGNGKSAVPMSHTSSVAEVIWRSIQNDTARGKIYNVIEDGVITRVGFLKMVRENLYPAFKIVKIPLFFARIMAFGMRTMLKMIGKTPPTRLHPHYMRLFALSVFYKSDKAKQDLGWQSLTDLTETIKDMLSWHREKIFKPKSEMLIPELPVKVTSKQTLKVGVVGCGVFGAWHHQILKRLPQAEVAAVCDPDTEAAETTAAKYKIPKTFSSMGEMLDKESIDVVHILSPPQTHAPLSIEAMQKGCHVLIEKPMALDAREAEKMIQAAEENKVSLCTDHTLLYNDGMIQARQWIQEGRIGTIHQIESWFGTAFSTNIGSPFLQYDAKDSWVYKMPGQLFQDLMPHPVSVLLDVVGSVDDISVISRYNKYVPHMKVDELRILLEKKDMLGTLTLSFGVTPRHSFLNIYGSQGTIKVDFLLGVAFLYNNMGMLPKVVSRNLIARRHAKKMLRKGREQIFSLFTGKRLLLEGHETLFRLFYKHILDGTALPVSNRNSLETMKLMDRIWEQVEF